MANPTGWDSSWGEYKPGVNDFSTQIANAENASDKAAIEAARNNYINQQSGGTGTITDSAGHSYSTTNNYTGGSNATASTVGYNENTDYTAEIQKAISNGASIDYINQLVAERNAKIAANPQKYGQYANDTQSIVNSYIAQMQNPQISALQNEIDSLNAYIEKIQNQNSNDSATEYLKQMYATQKEQELANLKSQYNESRNDIAAQSALSNNLFNEQAIAAGLNTGVSGQAALARSAAQRSNLASLDEAYLQALQSAQSEGDSALAQALYQELVRQQNLETQQKQFDDELALAYSQLSAQNNNTAPTLTAAQAKSAYDSGLRTQEVLNAYDYYYGTNYANGGATNATQNTQNTQESKKVSYNNGSHTQKEIEKLQELLEVEVDGYWGPATQAAAKEKWGITDADTAWDMYGSKFESGNNDFNRIMAAVVAYMNANQKDKAQALLDSNWDSFSETQRNTIIEKLF